MNVQAIYQLVSQWYDTGLLAESDKPAVLEAYTEVTGLTFSGSCKKCQLSDVQHALRYHFIKVLNLPTMSNQKWMLRKDIGSFQVHGLSYAYINKSHGPESESAKHLTDDVAEKIMKDDPGSKEIFVVNPDYNPTAKVASTGSDEKEKTDAKPKVAATGQTRQQKAAQTKKENAKKADTDKQADDEQKEADLTALQEKEKEQQSNDPDTNQ